jgi:hypothetical protein
MTTRTLRRGSAAGGALACTLFVAGRARPDPTPPHAFIDPYDLPDAPRPPTLPELTHPDVELTGESTFGVLHPSVDAETGVRPPDVGAYVQRFSLEWPLGIRRLFVGGTYELAAAVPPGGGTFKFVGGNADVYARTVWATSTGLAFGGGVGVTIPIPNFDPGSDAARISTAAATLRPWDEAFFQPGYLTFRPFVDVRDVDGPLVLQLREGLDFQVDTESGPGFQYAAVLAAYIGYRVFRKLSVGIEAFERYYLPNGGPVPDDRRAVFAVSPNARLMTPYVQPALSFVTNVGAPLYASVGSVDSWWALRLAATVVWDPVRQAVKPGQDVPVRTVVVGPVGLTP